MFGTHAGLATAHAAAAETLNMTKDDVASAPEGPRMMASRIAPARVTPIDVNGIRYEAVWGALGLFRATEVKTGKVLWELTLYHYRYDDRLERDVQDVFVSAMAKESPSTILVTDERATVYRVDLEKMTSRIARWPVGVKLVAREPLTVELVIANDTDRTVKFDKPSIGFGGRLSNDLFRVQADGVELPYGGMMLKRAPPGDFLTLKPLSEFRVRLDLSADYAVPATAKKIEVRFAHANHFSPDDFQLYSPIPLVIR
ncbi:hypothetical protein EZJ19_10355 [Parasulfuritortus cantonensis]|uniref:Uncharacterized protein n=1 Tax=Parasulfuritortus cantonensis TaxID=2528202 RepID=A0A4R1B9A5_9PROT|nr:hypothetical protein [Parasulfuritortus cantonensis]TCJ13443.1 hypothetical protein EZJ19_10355 [Parasulfuritortus cantonensis]